MTAGPIVSLGVSSGSVIATSENFYFGSISHRVLYVDNSNDNAADGGGLAGQNKSVPLLTLAQAVSNANDGDIIVLLAGHNETISSNVAISKYLSILGEGSSGGIPGPTIVVGHASTDMLTVSVPGIIQNVRFKPHATAASSASYVTGSSCASYILSNCRFEQNGFSTGKGVDFPSGNGALHVRGSTFVVTSVSSATDGSESSPSGAALDAECSYGLFLHEVVVDGGTMGWSVIAIDDSQSGYTTSYGMSMLRGATGSAYLAMLNVAVSSGGGRMAYS